MPADSEPLDLRAVRAELGLSQAELADLLGVSARTVQSCEQGWRQPSPSLERHCLLLLMAHRHGPALGELKCWETCACNAGHRSRCLAYRSRQGHLCWFLTGNICQGRRLRNWPDKKAACRQCEFFRRLLGETEPKGECRDEGGR